MASLAGYSYQLWHSLLAWLTLGVDDRLQLEGNEDIDVLRGDQAVTTQVKHTSKTITLRSKEAIEAINNFWAAKGRNPGVRLKFRFLSSAEAGCESGDHFGGLKGVDVWQAARRGTDRAADEAAADRVRGFLLSLQATSKSLVEWLTAASAGEVLTQLMEPMDWDLGASGTTDVKLLVEEQLVRLGDHLGILPSNARRAAPALLERVLATATDPGDRLLGRNGLLDAFEGATAVMVPAAGSALMGRFARHGKTYGELGATTSTYAVEAAARDGVPELPSILLRREVFLASVLVVHAKGFACLHGSTGMGKSTVAALAAARMRHPPLWLDLREHKEQHAVVRAAAAFLLRTAETKALVLDDLVFEADSRPLQDAVAAALAAARAVGGAVLVTSATGLPLPLLLRLQLDFDCQLRVPPLDEGDIEQLFLAHGLTKPAARRRWAKLVHAQTQGHPQLVDARVQSLRRSGFPDVLLNDIQLVPEEIHEVRNQARMLIAGLPAQQRDLLHRLSLDGMLFRRKSAILMAGLAPIIDAPGDALDALVGPWVERTPGRRYRISPLVLNAGRAANGDAWAKQMHHGIASCLLVGEIDQFDVLAICTHSILGGNGGALATVCLTLSFRSERLAEIAGMLGWLVHVDPTAKALGLDRKGAAAVRIAQFDIAAYLDEDAMAQAVEALETGTRLLSPANASDRSMRLVAICKLLMRTEVYLAPRMIVSLVAELVGLQADDTRIAEAMQKFQARAHAGVPDRFDLEGMLATFMPGRLRSTADLLALWGALADLPNDMRRTLLAPFSQDPTLAAFTTDAVWLRELRSDAPNWPDLVSALLLGYERARDWGCIGLAAAAAVTAMRIMNEQLALRLRAFRLGREALRDLGTNNRIADAMADVMDTARRPRAAHRLRAPILSSWLPTAIDGIGPALVRKKAARSTALAGEWAFAAVYFSEAAEFLRPDGDQDIFRAGLLADAGHAASRAGDKPDAVGLLTASFRLLRGIPNEPDNRRAYRLHKLIGNLLNWLVVGTRYNSDGIGSFEQQPGTCSDFEIAKDMSDLPRTPIEYTGLNLCRFGAGDVQYRQELADILDWLMQSPLIMVRSVASKVAVDAAIADIDLRATLETAVRHARNLVFSMRFEAAPESLFLEGEIPADLALDARAIDELIKKPVLSCVTAMIARDGWPPADLDVARVMDIPDAGGSFGHWLSILAEARAASSMERWTSFSAARKTKDWYSTMLFALSLADDPTAANERIGHCHVALFQAARSGTMAVTFGECILVIFVRRWSIIARQGFRLKYPRLTLPELEVALMCEDRALGKAARILSAGLPAVGLHPPTWLRDMLSSLDPAE